MLHYDTGYIYIYLNNHAVTNSNKFQIKTTRRREDEKIYIDIYDARTHRYGLEGLQFDDHAPGTVGSRKPTSSVRCRCACLPRGRRREIKYDGCRSQILTCCARAHQQKWTNTPRWQLGSKCNEPSSRRTLWPVIDSANDYTNTNLTSCYTSNLWVTSLRYALISISR